MCAARTQTPSCAAAVYSGSDAWPLRMVTLPDDSVAAQIAGRSVLLKVGLGVFGGVLVGKSVGKWLAVFVWWVWRRRWPGCSALRKVGALGLFTSVVCRC